jgi:hypothetical protein
MLTYVKGSRGGEKMVTWRLQGRREGDMAKGKAAERIRG